MNVGQLTFSLPSPGKLPVDCECSHLKTSISTFFPFSLSFPFPGYCEPAFSSERPALRQNTLMMMMNLAKQLILVTRSQTRKMTNHSTETGHRKGVGGPGKALGSYFVRPCSMRFSLIGYNVFDYERLAFQERTCSGANIISAIGCQSVVCCNAYPQKIFLQLEHGCARVAHCVTARCRNFSHYCRPLRQYDV